jgi:mRNA interferase YafQ
VLKIRRQRTYLKDLAKVKMSNQHYSKYILFLAKILNGEELPNEARDHALMGEYRDCRELHVSGDLLIVYFTTKTELVLIRIGTHSQLFK